MSELVIDRALLPLCEVVARLSISRRLLYREIAAGRFPRPVKIGRKALFPVGDIDGYLAQLKEKRGAL